MMAAKQESRIAGSLAAESDGRLLNSGVYKVDHLAVVSTLYWTQK